MENYENLKVLVNRFGGLIKDIKDATTQEDVTKAEREGTELMREIQLVSPRIWDDFIALDREQRNKIAKGLVEKTKKSTPKKTTKKTAKK